MFGSAVLSRCVLQNGSVQQCWLMNYWRQPHHLSHLIIDFPAEEPANHAANTIAASTSPLQLPAIQNRFTHKQAYCVFTLMHVRSARHTVAQRQNKLVINTDLSVTSIHTHMQSSPCQGRLLFNQYLPVMSLSRRGVWIRTHTHIHTRLTTHTSIKQAYTISPSILISTWLKRFTKMAACRGDQRLITRTL